jgi:peroxiredoxin
MSATEPSTLADQIADFHTASARSPQPEAMAAFGIEQRALEAAGVPDGVAAVGIPMPDGQLLDVVGEPTSLTESRDGAPAVVVFYRGAWCPYCNMTLHAYQEQLAGHLAERGVSLIAISPQKPDGSLTMQEKHELTFSVLSDPGNQIAGALGVLTAPGDDTRAAQLELGLDLTAVNADGTTAIPMPTVALVDAGGTLRWIDVHPNYATRTEPRAILDAVDSLD